MYISYNNACNSMLSYNRCSVFLVTLATIIIKFTDYHVFNLDYLV
jgi:hypothetical protein